MEKITSRKNTYIRHLRSLATDGDYRRETGEYLCDGLKHLTEAITFGAQLRSVLWKDEAQVLPELESTKQYIAPAELFDYASPLKNSPGPVFSVAIPDEDRERPLEKAIVLDGVQDPGNVGTVIRTANAFGIDTVILTGACADLYHPKTVRATMGAVFRQRVLRMDLEELACFLKKNTLPLYGAALSDTAVDARTVDLKKAAVAVGSEGSGLSRELLELCRRQVIIPMDPKSESLNAAVAAAVLMWEMAR